MVGDREAPMGRATCLSVTLQRWEGRKGNTYQGREDERSEREYVRGR